MKKLLSMLAVSTLVGTNASNLKPLFTNNLVSHGFKSNQINNKNISVQNLNISNPFINTLINDIKTKIIKIAPNGTIWIGTEKGLWKSTDGSNFEQVQGFNYVIYDIAFAPDGTVWISASGIYKSTDGTHFSKISGDVNGLKFEITVDGTIWLSNKIYHCLWKSTDGNNFSKIIFTTSSKIYATKYFTVSPDGTVYVVWQEFDDTLHFYKSTDGTNFTDILGINGAINDINFSTDGTVYVASTGGLYKSTDGTNFSKMVLNDSFWNIKISPDGTVWVGGLTSVYKSTDGTNFLNVSKDGNFVSNLKFGLDGTIYSCNTIEVLKSTDGTNFTKIGNFGKERIFSIDVATDGTVYVGTIGTLLMHGKLYKIDIINNLLTMNKPNYVGDKDNGFIYKNEQKIGIKNNYLDKAILDNKNITIPTTDLNILVGKHHLVLILKDEYKVLSGNKTGTINFVFFIKNQINELDYTTNIDDTQLYSGLVSKDGNTDGSNIIQTKSKVGSLHPANLYLAINDKLIAYRNSYFVQGTVDDITNDFTETGTHENVYQNLSIKTDGIYHLHLVDVVGNTYDSYLELGENNWKLKGTFNDSELDKLKTKLNVTVNLNDPTQKQQAMGWLHQYESFAENNFYDAIKTNGKGFDSEIKNQITSYTTFLKPLIYDISNEPKFDDGLDKDLLVKTITDKAKEILNKSLDELPKNLNINTSNVVNKSTLQHYTNWIINYKDFINKNKDTWINDVVKVASRGFATTEQENQIKEQVSQFLNNDNIKNYLKNIVWEDNKLLKATSNDYQQYVKLDELQKDTIDWVNTNMSEINTAYQNAIKQAESGLNLHGYSIDKILNGRPKPQTKSEIDNFADGKSYHDWLQSQANIKFRGWQLAMGFGIAIPLLLVVVAIAWVIRSRTNPKYNGVARAKKNLRHERKQLEKEKHKK